MTASAVRAMFRSHPDHPAHMDAMSRCIDACFTCVETCTACADACLSEKQIDRLVTCIRINLDCAAVCAATGSIVARSNKAGNRQPLEAQITTSIAFCRACARECTKHAEMHKHCRACAEACEACAVACDAMLSSLRMPA
ncbi:MAG: four-helix bundle copper-binding protein [Hyphomicrobiales bacterium]